MIRAVEEFFPESGILDDEGVLIPAHPRASSSGSGQERPHPMRRVNTGLSSIVSNTNGEKPGGFVLVIDGTALRHVSPLLSPVLPLTRRPVLGAGGRAKQESAATARYAL
jgi:hypothetical protein